MAYIIIGRKGKTIRYVSDKGNKGMRRLPIAVNTMKEARLVEKLVKNRKNSPSKAGWTIRIKKI